MVNEKAQVNNNNLFIAKDDNFKIVSRPSNNEIVKVDSKVEARRELRVFVIVTMVTMWRCVSCDWPDCSATPDFIRTVRSPIRSRYYFKYSSGSDRLSVSRENE